MSIIKVNLSIESIDILPYLLKINETKEITTTSDANSNASQSGQLTIGTTPVTINTEIDGGIDDRALVYVKNTGAVAGASAADVNIIVSSEGTAFLDIAPGEFAFFPYNAGANSTLTVQSASDTGYCDFFIAELT
jgi:hypothetical protein